MANDTENEDQSTVGIPQLKSYWMDLERAAKLEALL